MGETEKRKKREKSEAQLLYVKQIKEWLNRALGECGLKEPQLLEMLERTYGFNINKGTLHNLFDISNPNVDFFCIMAVCKFFGFEFDDLLAPAVMVNENGTEEVENYRHIAEKIAAEAAELQKTVFVEKKKIDAFWQSIAKTRKKFPVLKDEGYIGDFKGFITSPTKNGSVKHFDLAMKKDEHGVMHARATRTVNDGNMLSFSGVPLLARAYNAVIMFLTDEKGTGEFYFLAFGFKKYRSDEGLIYRKGLAITGETFGSAAIVSQNFLIFKNDLRPEDEKYIPGLLKSPDDEFCVSIDDAKELAEKYPEVKQFLDAMGDDIDRRTKEMLVLKESNIITLNILELSPLERLKALLLLKSKAVISEKHAYRDESTYADLANDYLMGNVSDDEKEIEPFI